MKRFTDWLFIAALTVLPLIFHWRILTPSALDRGSFPAGDFGEQFYAFANFAYAELAQGRLPLWNPYTYAGHPFLADVQSAVFYPPSLIVMLVAHGLGGFSLVALEWQAVVHFSLAGMFMYLFAQRELEWWGDADGGRGRSETRSETIRWAAFVSALVFTYGGYLTSYPSQQLAVLETDVWLPLILLCLSWAMRSFSAHENGNGVLRLGGASAGLCFGIAILAGHPQSALYILLVSIAYALFAGRQRRVPWRSVGLSLALMLAVALGVSAVQWVPSLEFMRLSSRQSLSYADYARGFELQDPLQLLLPGSVSFYSPLYVGIVPLVLVMVALWVKRTGGSEIRPCDVAMVGRARGGRLFWFGLALFALALSFGGNLFLYPILYLFAPVFALFRQQERAAFVFSFALAMLAGAGALNLSRALPRDEHRRLRGIGRLCLGALGGAVAFFILLYFTWMVAELRRDSPFREATERAAWLMLMLGALCVLLWLRLRGRLRRAALLLALAAVTTLDLFTVNWQTNFLAAPPEAQMQPLAFLAGAGLGEAGLRPAAPRTTLFRTFNEFRIYGNFGDVFHLEDTWGASPLRLARYEQFHKLPMERIWRLLNVQYVITWRKSLSEMGVQSEIVAEEKVSDKETTYVHRLAAVSPRAALVGRTEVVRAPDDVLARLAASDFDFARQAIVEAPLPTPLAPDARSVPTLEARTANSSEWRVYASGDALFVLSENDYPGWRAFVDGRETPIVRANFVMMAVPVPAGEHRVAFVFDPLSVKLGAGISLLALVGLCGAWLWRAVRRGKAGARQPAKLP